MYLYLYKHLCFSSTCLLSVVILIGSVAKWQCCPLREATSAALPYTRRAGFWAVHKSTRPVQPRSTQPQPPAPSVSTNLVLQLFLVERSVRRNPSPLSLAAVRRTPSPLSLAAVRRNPSPLSRQRLSSRLFYRRHGCFTNPRGYFTPLGFTNV